MRMLPWMILGVGAILATAPATAQTYDPRFPVCLQTYAPRGGGYIDCSYTSLPQCNMTASGRAAECYVNPFFAPPPQQPPRRAHRRRRPVH